MFSPDFYMRLLVYSCTLYNFAYFFWHPPTAYVPLILWNIDWTLQNHFLNPAPTVHLCAHVSLALYTCYLRYQSTVFATTFQIATGLLTLHHTD
jgi:hypothetical protein